MQHMAVEERTMSDESNNDTQGTEQPKPFHERWWWIDGLFWFAEAIIWAVVGVVRLAAWIVVGILTSCS
jgi:hypothetical protein